MPSFLLEIFSEEIPARMQTEAVRHLQSAFTDSLKQARIDCSEIKSFITPRRIAITSDGIPEMQPDITVEKKGPKTTAPQAALDGFLRKEGLSIEALEKRMIGKDETWFAVIHQKGQHTSLLLKTIVEKILSSFPWPKSMRWGSGETRWVRPLHSIICILGDKIVPVEFAGIKTGNTTYGHRFLAPQAITIADADEYESKLLAAKVIADQEKRKAEILKQAEAVAVKSNLTLKRDDGLLNEVTGLVEWPNVLMGSIDDKFMDLPPEVLTSEMRAHQKYFALLDKSGKLSAQFFITANMTTNDNGKAVIAGNERVLRARLADGRFFFDQDRKKTLEQWAAGLKNVTFHAKVGTIADQCTLVATLALDLAEVLETDRTLVMRTIELYKADLATGMVGEFPELQGIMGRYYALYQKENEAVADAIKEHYLPLGPDSPVPTKKVSRCVALADKLGTLIAMFKIGEKPTGSKDPFALRRSALGIIRIILENKLRIHLKEYLNDELISFFSDRLIVQLKEEGIRADIIKAVMANGYDDLVWIKKFAAELQKLGDSLAGKDLLFAYKRASNIVIAEEKKDNRKYKEEPSVNLFTEKQEEHLYKVIKNIASAIPIALKEESFKDLMEMAGSMRDSINDFFDKILVNDNNAKIRSNRLCLLAQFCKTLDSIADFSLIEG